MSHSAIAIANTFLDIAAREKNSVTPMKLQKLVYYAHGWHLGLFEEPLIDETLEAWRYGPVIQSLYHEFKRFGGEAITAYGTELDQDTFQYIEPRLEGDDNARRVVEAVWKEYSPYTATQLSSMSHADGGPWKTARTGRETARSVPIPNEAIKEYFKNLADMGA